MALLPNYNNDYADVTYSNVVNGDTPVLNLTSGLSAFPNVGEDYVTGCLLALTGTAGVLQCYDSTASPAQTFAGVFYDDNANIASGMVNYAIADKPMTEWNYTSLVGKNSGQTDIDALIAAGKAVKISSGGTYVVKFGVMGK